MKSETRDIVLTRRSIRAYTDTPVTDDTVEYLLQAAMAAPSACNQQPWRFVVIRDRETLDGVPRFHRHAGLLEGAPVGILVCGDLELDVRNGYWVQDCSAATQNILIAANGAGLGACWIGLYPRQERVEGMRALVGLPEHIVPLALVAVGWPAEEKGPSNRFDASRIHGDRWGRAWTTSTE